MFFVDDAPADTSFVIVSKGIVSSSSTIFSVICAYAPSIVSSVVSTPLSDTLATSISWLDLSVIFINLSDDISSSTFGVAFSLFSNIILLSSSIYFTFVFDVSTVISYPLDNWIFTVFTCVVTAITPTPESKTNIKHIIIIFTNDSFFLFFCI